MSSDDDPEEQPHISPTRAVESVVRDQWDGSARPHVAVVEAVAAATDRDPTELSTLHQVIDGDALDTLLTGQTDSTLLISFAYDGVMVTVDGSGAIEVALTEPQQ